jgi:hypothetical protein
MIGQDFLALIDTFFNVDAPCPAEIKDCIQLREEYKIKLAQSGGATGCSACKLRSLRNFFTQIIHKNYKSG